MSKPPIFAWWKGSGAFVCERRMLRYCLGINVEEHSTNETIKQEVKVTNVLKLMRRK